MANRKKATKNEASGCGCLTLIIFGLFASFFSGGNRSSATATSTLTPLSVTTATEIVEVSFTSDPSGANLYIDSVYQGETPLSVKRPVGTPFYYSLAAEDIYTDYDLYKLYGASYTPLKTEAISVWIERTTLEEQQAQIARSESARAALAPEPVPKSVQQIEPIRACCKYCSKGKPCGDTCISRSYTCHKGPGCAC
ncbi:MAG: PEGA domain-containing protein [Trueperaceae bacterium]